MATEKGREFINKYKGTDCLKSTWETVYKKGHITLDEFAECANLNEEEKASYQKQIDICEEDRIKTNKELTEEQMKMQKIIADLEIDILNKE